MRRKLLSLALALIMCLGLTVPALAVKTGDTTVATKEGNVFSFSKPVVGTEQIKFNYELDTADMAGKDEKYSEGGMYFDKNLADETASEVTALLVSIGTVITTQGTNLCIVAEDKTHLLWTEEYNKAEFSPGELSGTDWKYDNYLDEQGETVWRCAYFKPGAVFYVSSYVVGESADEYTVTDTGHIFVKLVEDTTSSVITDPGSTTPTIEVENIPASGTALAGTQTVTVDGKATEFQMYALADANGNLTNYIKLRDMAYVLNGTEAQFAVGYDGIISLTTGKPYEAGGTEMTTPFSGDRAYTGGAQTVKIDGKDVAMTAITLTDDNGGGYNYFKLRDLGKALGFNVGYNNESGVFIESDKPYSE